MADPPTPPLDRAARDLEAALQRFTAALRAQTPDRQVTEPTATPSTALAADPAGTAPPPVPPPPPSRLFNALRQWRLEQARLRRIPPYIIATDAVLRNIEASRPTTTEALAAVRGVGPARAVQNAADILRIVAENPLEAASA